MPLALTDLVATLRIKHPAVELTCTVNLRFSRNNRIILVQVAKDKINAYDRKTILSIYINKIITWHSFCYRKYENTNTTL